MEKEKNIKSIIITKSSNSQKPLVQLEKLSKYGKKNNNTEQNNKNIENNKNIPKDNNNDKNKSRKINHNSNL